MSETKRESGHYWVSTNKILQWTEVAFYIKRRDRWIITGDERELEDSYFVAINETKLQPPA